jgi:hypothetical protein
MPYSNDSAYLKFNTADKTANKLADANKEMDDLMAQDQKKLLLRDQPAVKSNQNVFDALSE